MVPSLQRTRLIVLFGGRSAEHDISRISAFHVLRVADRSRYEPVVVGIDRDGRWHACRDNSDDPDATAVVMDGEIIDPYDLLALTDDDPRLGSSDDPRLGSGDDPRLGSGDDHDEDAVDPTSRPETVVFPVLHGPNGEDGTIQGLLETFGVPYVGSGVLGSAVSMDKAMAKTILGAVGIAQPAWRQVRRSDLTDPGLRAHLDSIIGELGTTLFVKPANMGSSIGVSKVHDIDELTDAIEVALDYDDLVVIEEAVTAREIETAVLGNEELVVGSIGEILPAADFYDYDDKYNDGAARTVIPAPLRPGTEDQIREVAASAYRALRAEGMARVDLFVDEDHPDPQRRVLVNEINTIPGFTPISMYPQLWKHAGVEYSELIDRLVDLARLRHQRMARHHVDVVSTRESE